MKKTIIVVPKYTERAADFIKTLMADTEFSASRFCALLSELDADGEQDGDGSGFPLELKRVAWNPASAYAGASALLQLSNHFSGYPDEVLVLEDDTPFCDAELAGPGFGTGMRTFALALPELLLKLLEERPGPNSIVHVRLACTAKGVVAESILGALRGFYSGLRSESGGTFYCSFINDESDSVMQLVPFCVKVMNISRKEHKD